MGRCPAADVPLAQGAAVDHLAGENPGLRCHLGAFDRRHYKLDGRVDDLGHGLADRRQPDVLPARHLHVVQPDQADILRAPKARRLQSPSARRPPADRRRRNRPAPGRPRGAASPPGPRQRCNPWHRTGSPEPPPAPARTPPRDPGSRWRFPARPESPPTGSRATARPLPPCVRRPRCRCPPHGHRARGGQRHEPPAAPPTGRPAQSWGEVWMRPRSPRPPNIAAASGPRRRGRSPR